MMNDGGVITTSKFSLSYISNDAPHQGTVLNSSVHYQSEQTSNHANPRTSVPDWLDSHKQKLPSRRLRYRTQVTQDVSPTETAHGGVDLGQHTWGQRRHDLIHVCIALSPYVLLSVLCLMLPGRGSGQQRDPPTWDPANDRYSFDMWTRDLHAWTVLVSDRMDSSQQAAAVRTIGRRATTDGAK